MSAVAAFLEGCGWADAEAFALAGDASSRRYKRLMRRGASAILMEDPGGDTRLFARLARHLRGLGLSAPEILAEDHDSGLLLIEDLGDGLIARLATDPETEKRLYFAATDVLVELHRHDAPGDLPVADAPRLAQMTDVAFHHYAGDSSAMEAAITAFEPILARHAVPADVMVLRDYHAENILDLPQRTGPARAGLLDFQDALQGHRAYDLVSLIEDARRDLFPGLAGRVIRHYLTATGLPETPFRTALAVLGAQRNLRILGVFARLAADRGKPDYVDLIPRVWAHLQGDLAHPALAPLKPILDAALPPPTPAFLEHLKAPCLTR